MREINLAEYQVTQKVKGGDGKIIEISGPYNVRDSILNLMFQRELQLTGAELVKQNMLAIKIESCVKDVILLENEEYSRIKRAIDTFKGFARSDVEFVSRINDAEEVAVK